MTNEEFGKLGKTIREALPHHFIIAAFSAELIGESYPLTKCMWDIVFQSYTDEELGRNFVEWQKDRLSVRVKR